MHHHREVGVGHRLQIEHRKHQERAGERDAGPRHEAPARRQEASVGDEEQGQCRQAAGIDECRRQVANPWDPRREWRARLGDERIAGVLRRDARQRVEEGDGQEQPADGVLRLARRHQATQDGVADRQHDLDDVSLGQAVNRVAVEDEQADAGRHDRERSHAGGPGDQPRAGRHELFGRRGLIGPFGPMRRLPVNVGHGR